MSVDRPSIPEPSDAAAIAASIADPERFRVVFDRHFDAVHAYLTRRVGTGRAEDLVAATFTVAFERRRSFRRDADSARPWLLGIATNLMRSEWRAEQRALATLARLAPERVAVGPSDPAEVRGLRPPAAPASHAAREAALSDLERSPPSGRARAGGGGRT